MTLHARQLRYLRGLTHGLHPVVTVAARGLTDNVLAEIDAALQRHELVKLKLRGDRGQRRTWIDEIGRACGAELVHQIGQVACYFRRNQDKPVIALPDDAEGAA